jgi:hypothetical protein
LLLVAARAAKAPLVQCAVHLTQPNVRSTNKATTPRRCTLTRRSFLCLQKDEPAFSCSFPLRAFSRVVL